MKFIIQRACDISWSEMIKKKEEDEFACTNVRESTNFLMLESILLDSDLCNTGWVNNIINILICKLLWIKASTKLINVNVLLFAWFMEEKVVHFKWVNLLKVMFSLIQLHIDGLKVIKHVYIHFFSVNCEFAVNTFFYIWLMWGKKKITIN